MTLVDHVYGFYTRRLRSSVADAGRLPAHVGLVMDGNRRWARQMGLENPSLGHRVGAEHIDDVLLWCERLGIKHVTAFVCSTENLTRRGDAEIAFLMQVIEDLVAERLTQQTVTWQIHVAGMLDVLPSSTARALKLAAERTRTCATGAHLTLAVGYGGRQDILEAVRELLQERAEAGATPADVARSLTTEDIGRHLDTADRPDPDLIIRTSGEQRMSNFLLWQATGAELYFCETFWPAFRELDFLRAVRTFAARKQRRL